jgi:hypothetical protein
MKASDHQDQTLEKSSRAGSRWLWLLVIACGLLILIGLLRTSRHKEQVAAVASTNERGEDRIADSAGADRTQSFPRPFRSAPATEPTAEEVVAGKLAQFAQSRRGYAHALAQRHKVEVSGDAERFFDAVESGDWDKIEAAFKVINGGDSSAGHAEGRPPGVQSIWPAIIDAYGAAEQVHEWPAQKLLDYGNSILGALKPGMVYVGGTDNGRWIPELLNDTSDGERHVIVTQNALADSSYLDYLRFQYDDRLSNFTAEDSKGAFHDYVSDARKRLEHDQQFPDQPKQVGPREDVQVIDGKTQVSGQVAVMAINEKLLQMLMEKNPGLSFAIQESFPLKGTYSDALPLGPLMELRARDGQNSFTPERAAQSLAYWQTTAQQVLDDPEAAGSPAALKSYSHDAVAAANLLAAHSFTGEAEEGYRLAAQLWPENPEPVGHLADMLARGGRENEARQLFDEFTRQHPGQRKELERISAAWKVIGPAPTATH